MDASGKENNPKSAVRPSLIAKTLPKTPTKHENERHAIASPTPASSAKKKKRLSLDNVSKRKSDDDDDNNIADKLVKNMKGSWRRATIGVSGVKRKSAAGAALFNSSEPLPAAVMVKSKVLNATDFAKSDAALQFILSDDASPHVTKSRPSDKHRPLSSSRILEEDMKAFDLAPTPSFDGLEVPLVDSEKLNAIRSKVNGVEVESIVNSKKFPSSMKLMSFDKARMTPPLKVSPRAPCGVLPTILDDDAECDSDDDGESCPKIVAVASLGAFSQMKAQEDVHVGIQKDLAGKIAAQTSQIVSLNLRVAQLEKELEDKEKVNSLLQRNCYDLSAANAQLELDVQHLQIGRPNFKRDAVVTGSAKKAIPAASAVIPAAGVVPVVTQTKLAITIPPPPSPAISTVAESSPALPISVEESPNTFVTGEAFDFTSDLSASVDPRRMSMVAVSRSAADSPRARSSGIHILKGLAPKCDQRQVAWMCKKYGAVRSVSIDTKTKTAKVVFSNPLQAAKAVNGLKASGIVAILTVDVGARPTSLATKQVVKKTSSRM